MRVETINSGIMQNNTYAVIDGGVGVIIDPSRNNRKLEKFIDENPDVVFKYIILTHAHFDHSWDAVKVREKTGAKIALHRLDQDMFDEVMRAAKTPGKADILLENGDVLECGGLSLEILHTPGHTAGSVCVLCGDYMFSGDTLFKGTVGRTDLGGNVDEMRGTMKNVLAKIEKDYTVLPGHGEKTALREEQRFNRYLCLSNW